MIAHALRAAYARRDSEELCYDHSISSLENAFAACVDAADWKFWK